MYLKNSKKNENPDVLKCLADLSNEEVFTSPNIAKKIISKGIKEVAFDRGKYKYHGLIKILADAARVEGLNF